MNHLAAPVLAIDLGKTSCRARITSGSGDDLTVLAEARGHGAPGLADHEGAELSARAVLETVAHLPADLLAEVQHVGIGAAGVEAAPHEVAAFTAELRLALGATIAVVNDALAAHAGAFAGGPGTVLIAGTGSVVFDVDADGSVKQIDGWGPWLGDEGSGRWIGQQGLEACMRAFDGRGPATTLLADAEALIGSIPALPRWVSSTGAPARQLGTFAPTVITRAEEGDTVAADIVDAACAHLAVSAAAAGTGAVCVVGGIASHPYVAAHLATAMHEVGVDLVAPRGDALDGARLVALDTAISYDGRVVRDDVHAV
ncbi:N-acetylglucosamine kinase [Plantibacter sp. 2H11-2]|uniref:N-acetylglucosamine kinase n=1 Tax=Plantibacter sp. 2H11-2 TaxID=3414431 RepID=UPI003CEF9BEA